MKQLKAIVAVVTGLFAFTSVQAGEMTVSGTMQATYSSSVDQTTGNSLGMNTDLTFKGSTDTDFGTATWTMGTDGTFLSESGADHTLKLATGYGTFGVGNSGDAANAVDDITPTAFEEANGSGSGNYSAADVGSGMDGSMSVSYGNSDIAGTGISVAYNYYPELDGKTNNEKGVSANENHTAGSAESINVGIPVSGLPVIGDSPLGGMKVTFGYAEHKNKIANNQTLSGGTMAIVMPVGPLSVGFQKKAYQVAQADTAFYKDDIIGVAYAVNDDLAISYNIIESVNHVKGQNSLNIEQETKAINLAYTVGGLTLGFQDAKTSNSGWSSGTDDDARTISIKTAF